MKADKFRSAAFILEDKRFAGKYGSGVFRALSFAFQPYLFLLAILVVIGFVGRLSMLSVAWVIGVWTDTLCTGAACRPAENWAQELTGEELTLVLLGLSGLGFFGNLLFRIPFTRIGALGVSRIYDAVTYATSRLPQSFFDRTPVGRIVSRFSSDYGAVIRMAGGPLGEFCTIVFDLAIITAFIGAANPLFLPLVVVTIALNLVVFKLNRNAMREARRNLSRERAPSIAHFAETSQGHSSIRLYTKENSFLVRFQSLVRRYLGSRINTVYVIQRFSFQMVFTTGLLLLLSAAVGLYLYHMGRLSVGDLGVTFTFVAMLSSTCQQFFDYIGRFDEALTGIERLDEYLGMPLEPGAEEESTSSFLASPGSGRQNAHRRSCASSAPERHQMKFPSTWPDPGALCVHNLSMRYGKDLPLVLDGVSFELRQGERLGVIGRTGSGKSSLISALFCLYPFESGTVSCNGTVPPLLGEHADEHLALVSLSRFRQGMSLIAQEPVLFRGTLRHNLFVPRFREGDQSVSGPDDSEMYAVLEAVGLGFWIRETAGGVGKALDFTVAEGGAPLSAGQRQLVCMARALLQKAPVIILDEATSCVDPRSEEQLMQASRDLLRGVTQVIVAHRLSTISDCDRILWLDHGRVKMLGDAPSVLNAFNPSWQSLRR